MTIQESCELLRISRPTFDKIRKQRRLRTLYVGKRPRFLEEDILAISRSPTPILDLAPDDRVDLTVFSRKSSADIQSAKTTFDLRRIRQFDPHGVLELFAAAAALAISGEKVTLLVEDNFNCNHLRTLGFFNHLERKCGRNVVWDRGTLQTNHEDFKYPIPLTNARIQKEESPAVAKLIGLLRQQGFSEEIGGYIGWIFGELADNATTHLAHSGKLSVVSDCYFLAQRFRFSDLGSDAIILGVADIGPGIHATLKRKAKYSALSDQDALLTAFKPNVSSWDDSYGRGKGLTDILTIAMGNRSVLRAESGVNVWLADFRKDSSNRFQSPRLPSGTRVTLVLLDREFEVKTREEVESYIDGRLNEK